MSQQLGTGDALRRTQNDDSEPMSGARRAFGALRKLSRPKKILVAVTFDFIACLTVGLIASLFVRFPAGADGVLAGALTGAVVTVLGIALCGGYFAVVRFMTGNSSFMFACAILVGTVVWLVTMQRFAPTAPAGLIYWGASFCAVFGSRFALSWAHLHFGSSLHRGIPIVIYGAGESGRQLAASLRQRSDYRPVGFIDDEATLHGLRVSGLKVHSPHALGALVRMGKIKEVFLAIPTASKNRRREILHLLSDNPVKVQTIPSLGELIAGKARPQELRPVEIEDVLGREPVAPDVDLIKSNIENKVVLVTGAGGSIGSELCWSISALNPRALILLDMSEHALFQIEQKLRGRIKAGHTIQIHPVMGSVENLALMRQVLQNYDVETVYHAAAYKHVPLVEMNPIDGVKNNVMSTKVLLEAISDSKVSTFVMISTDKAVRPTSVMGASKRVAELLVQAAAVKAGRCKMSIVRFGNVLNSSGSVLPLFHAQIASGGPITVTHPEVTRFFMTIPEAAQLVIQAGALGEHGDIFHLDMGQPVRIIDLARRLVRLHGLRERTGGQDGDIEIKIVGLRPGEKLYEELLIDNRAEPTSHSRIFRARERFLTPEELAPIIARLTGACQERDEVLVISLLRRLVEGFARPTTTVEQRETAERNEAGHAPLSRPRLVSEPTVQNKALH